MANEMELYECKFCSGNGSINFLVQVPQPDGDGDPVWDPRSDRCIICLGGKKVLAPFSAGEGWAVPCDVCGKTGRQKQADDDLSMPRPCGTCDGTGWVGGVPAHV